MNYSKEVIRLASLLQEAGFAFLLHSLFDGAQVVLLDSRRKRVADAICHSGSYGHEEGLLELMGLGVNEEDVGDTVEGYLTAEEIFKRWCNAMEGKG